ncbi:MAG: UbiD family decarboxylase [Ignavibacteriales bacterium]|nr:UbiD family decarboxylase [Ignavibacteriales bacterium]
MHLIEQAGQLTRIPVAVDPHLELATIVDQVRQAGIPTPPRYSSNKSEDPCCRSRPVCSAPRSGSVGHLARRIWRGSCID